jgi:hypothetical protein
MNDPMQDPDHWQARAKDTRAKADSFLVTKAQTERPLRIAEEYERLAARAEKWQLAETAKFGLAQ